MPEIILEQEEHALPLDDDTLFILLAMRYQGQIYIQGLDSVYDGRVNYDYTLIKPDRKRETPTEFSEKALNWIVSTFEVQDNVKTKDFTIRTFNNQKLKTFLDDYFKDFKTYQQFYMSEDAHKHVMFNFFEKCIEQGISTGRKIFIDRIVDDKQFKIIQYIGFLIQTGILRNVLFIFDNDGFTYKKAIDITFPTKEQINEFKEWGIRKARNDFYIWSNKPDVVYHLNNERNVRDLGIPARLCVVLYEIIDKNLTEITVELYRELIEAGRIPVVHPNKSISDRTIGKYFNKLNNYLKDIAGISEAVTNKHRGSFWEINL